jgi:alpha-ketoglutarate-dependent 2,4-dichlorophenoxyacetate dioxygenase
MSLLVEPLTAHFCARVSGVSVNEGIDEATFAELRGAFEEHSVLVLPGQPMDDEQQIVFSERFGPLERAVVSNPAGGSAFARQSNIDIKTGETIPADDRRMLYQKANMLWHADSTFKPVQSLCSILSAREVPPAGGATEFASTRALYESLSADEQRRLDTLEVEHDIAYSRRAVGFTFTEEEARTMPASVHPLVQVNPVTGRKSLLIGAHAKVIVGWSMADSRALLDDLLARATLPELCYRHEWQSEEIVIWDNRSVVHRATPYDNVRHRRLMQRTTVSLSD